MALNSNSLISVDEYLIYIAEDADIEVQRRARVEQLINWASTEVETHLGRTLISGSSASEVFDGLGQPHVELLHDRYVTKNAPLISDPSPKLYIRSGNEWSLVSDNYAYDAVLGLMYFSDEAFFLAGKSNYKAEYDYGYTSVDTIPDDIKAATCMITRHLDKLSTTQGKKSETIGTQTFSYDNEIPSAATRILDRHIRDKK